MDEYLSEQEQLERLTGWLRANVPWIVIGLAVGGLIVGGWRWWQARNDRNGVEAATSYSQVLDAFDHGDRTRGLDLVEQLRRSHPDSPYVDQADLAAARLLLETGQPDRALSYLQAVINHSRDAQLVLLARLRLARVQVAQNHPDAALTTLGTANQGAFEGRFAEVRGDAYFAKGDKAQALREYRAARAAIGPAQAANDLLDLKINDLAGAAPSTPVAAIPKGN
ncbi:MAG TPA: tetratricopeptide repeat protein [Steroidobacteraceae bacterium]|nr:tetratricopeptide repeat protein [Steroidobacteraceae bacterium]